jgi:photosystem II stability/assembly factor-like uncharacterized protein
LRRPARREQDLVRHRRWFNSSYDDGGKTWTSVTPPSISAWQKISLIEAGHFDANTAYAAVNTLRMDDLRPHIFATHDSGKTWTKIVNGMPAGQIVNAVREDPERKGLLFAGTEKGVYGLVR